MHRDVDFFFSFFAIVSRNQTKITTDAKMAFLRYLVACLVALSEIKTLLVVNEQRGLHNKLIKIIYTAQDTHSSMDDFLVRV